MATKVLVDTDSAQTISNKTFVGSTIAATLNDPVFSGTASGSLTDLTLTSPNIAAPDFSGTATGSLTNLALTTPTITNGTITAPTLSGTVVGTYTLGDTPTLAIADNRFTIVGSSIASKVIAFEADGATAATTLTLASLQTTSQQLSVPNLTASDTLVTTLLPQTITGVKTLTNPTMSAGTTTVPSLTITGGTNLTSAVAGAVENDAIGMYLTTNITDGRAHIPARQHMRLVANGSAITTIANFFGTTSNISLVASAYYAIEIVLYFLKTTTDTVVITLTNSAAPTSQNIYWEQSPITGLVAPPGTATMLAGQVAADATAAKAITTGSLTTAVNHYIRIRLELQNGAGTSLKIQGTSTTGSMTPLNGSYWTALRLPTGNTGTFAA